ncbi:M48 family metallopeptidase [Desulfuromonas sp. TF]|uniref:tetratricopeptide repeat protein n=1 Tax=Desulfuromonas sp. TF TaxID=1232410 RepID=UPI0004832FF0|nr:tetratricopeptide repeat protein [Desulfuromonas sp. TF]
MLRIIFISLMILFTLFGCKKEEAAKLTSLGDQAYEEGYIWSSIKYYKQALDMIPSDDEKWCKLGISYATVKQYEDAAKCFQKAYNLKPNNPKYFHLQAEVLNAVGAFKEALGFMDKSCQMGYTRACSRMLEIVSENSNRTYGLQVPPPSMESFFR